MQEKPKIATCSCQLTPGYAASFLFHFFYTYIRFHLLIADTHAAQIYAHQTVLMKTVSHCVFSCLFICLSGVTDTFLMLHAAVPGVHSVWKVPGLCMKTASWELCLSLISAQVCLWLHGLNTPPQSYLPKHKGLILQKHNKAGSKRLEGHIVG